MLDELRVANLGVIAAAHVEPGPGLVVLTGETGAGKTLLVGALGLLLGWPARSGLIGPSGDEARVDGRFVFEGVETTVARRVVPGRSRAYLDGEMVPLATIADRSSALVEVVAQHDHLRIGREDTLRRLVDNLLDEDGLRAKQAYAVAWERLEAARAVVEELGGDLRSLERERELVRYQAEEIGAAGFSAGDDDALTADARRLRHAEELQTRLASAHDALDGAADALAVGAGELDRVVTLDDQLAELARRAGELVATMRDLGSDVRRAVERTIDDPARLAEVEERLALLGALRRKYGASLSEVLSFGEHAARRADELDALLGRADEITDELEEARAGASAAGESLASARTVAARRLAEVAARHLMDLGFGEPVVEITIETSEPRASGCDRLALLFASDRRLPPGPVQKVASGGELSRLVLALRLAGGVAEVPVIVFDEIDAGIGGRVGFDLGRKLAGLARTSQVFVVTHLPQVAAFAESHIVVERDAVRARVRSVDGPERLEELARMLAGFGDSAQGQDHAAELLTRARDSRSEASPEPVVS